MVEVKRRGKQLTVDPAVIKKLREVFPARITGAVKGGRDEVFAEVHRVSAHQQVIDYLEALNEEDTEEGED